MKMWDPHTHIHVGATDVWMVIQTYHSKLKARHGYFLSLLSLTLQAPKVIRYLASQPSKINAN